MLCVREGGKEREKGGELERVKEGEGEGEGEGERGRGREGERDRDRSREIYTVIHLRMYCTYIYAQYIHECITHTFMYCTCIILSMIIIAADYRGLPGC